MKIGIVKPDFKIYGGFEVVIDHIKEGLQQKGHDVTVIKVDMTERLYENDMFKVSEQIYSQNIEFFSYIFAFKRFEALKLENYDIVISTQPPSFAIKHPRHISLFYHHKKIYYDLFDLIKEVKLFDKEAVFNLSAKIVHSLDKLYLTDNIHYLAGSRHVATRLKRFNNITDVNIFYAGIDDNYLKAYKLDYLNPICVGRHEFPKRPELFVHAMKHVKGLSGKVIGHGGRTEAVKKIDTYLTFIHSEGMDIPDNKLWKDVFFKIDKMGREFGETKYKSNIEFFGNVSQRKLIEEYSNSLCVVCPPYEEDYGLTAIEAMAFGKAVIACSDGGGYNELITNGDTGFIVEPDANQIAEKISFLRDNPSEVRRIGKNAMEESRKFSWSKSISDLDYYIKNIT